MARETIRAWGMAALAALVFALPVSLRAAGDEESPVARAYHTAPAAVAGETECWAAPTATGAMRPSPRRPA
jgi:hypothetical protein